MCGGNKLGSIVVTNCGGVQELPVAVAMRSKAFLCGHSISGVSGSNPAEGMHFCLLYFLCR